VSEVVPVYDVLICAVSPPQDEDEEGDLDFHCCVSVGYESAESVFDTDVYSP
jgi:hypothetical protein